MRGRSYNIKHWTKRLYQLHKNNIEPTLFRCSSPDVGVVGALVHQLRVLLVEAQDARPPRAAAAHAGRIRVQHHALVLMVQLPMGELHAIVFFNGFNRIFCS